MPYAPGKTILSDFYYIDLEENSGVNILPNVRIRYPGTIIGHREESLSAQNADTDFFQTCYKMTKKIQNYNFNTSKIEIFISKFLCIECEL